MKRFILIAALVLCLSVPTFAFGVVCNGTICGGSGVRAYQYDVFGTGVTSFEIGWHDGLSLSNVLMPAGWTWGIVSANVYRDDPFTQHGQISQWTGHCPMILFWTGFPVDNPVFGFDSTRPPHDVGWSVNTPGGPGQESWAAPVGTGQGPVHSPVPEPASLLALGSGLAALAGTILRRRG